MEPNPFRIIDVLQLILIKTVCLMEGLTSNALKIINTKIAAEKKAKVKNLTKVNKISNYYKQGNSNISKIKAGVNSFQSSIANKTTINNSHGIGQKRITHKIVDSETDYVLRQSDMILANQIDGEAFQTDGDSYNSHFQVNYVGHVNNGFDEVDSSDYSSDNSDNEQNKQLRTDYWLTSKKETTIPFYLQSMPINSNYGTHLPFYLITDQQKKDFNHHINDLVLNELSYINGTFWLSYAVTNGPNVKKIKELIDNSAGTNGFGLQCNNNDNKEQIKIQQIRQNKAQRSILNTPIKVSIHVHSKKINQKNTKDMWHINLNKMKGNNRYNWNCTIIAIYYFCIFFMEFVKRPVVVHLDDLKFRTYFMLHQSFMKHVICKYVNIK